MAQYRTENIEQVAVNCITDALFKSKRLSPFISINDKEPVWDGNIYIIRGNKSFSRIPVQVKGRTQKTLQKTPSFNVPLTNLKNYLRDGGIIYFVVFIVDDKKYPYFKMLAPIDLKRYIKIAAGKMTISIRLEAFGEVDQDMESRIIQFDYDRKRQVSFAENKILTIEEAIKQGCSLNYSIYGVTSEEEAFRYVCNNYIYLYANIGDEDNPVLHPIGDQAYKILISKRVEKPVNCGGVVYFDSYNDGSDGMRREVKIDDFITMERKKNNSESKININLKLNNLLFLKNELDFVRAIFKEGQFSLGEECIYLKDIKESDRKDVELRCEYWGGVFEALGKLNCDLSRIDASKFEDKDFNNLNLLKRIIVDNEEITQDHEVSGATTLNFGQYRVLLMAEQRPNGKFRIIDFFKLQDKNIFEAEKNNGEREVISMYSAIFQRPDVDFLVNIDYGNLINSYRIAATYNRNIHTYANQDVLNMISAYDRAISKDERLLTYALELIDFITELPVQECHNQEIYQINKLQIKKRLNRSFTKEEKNILFTLADSDIPMTLKWAANLLLEDYDRSDRLWLKLTEEERDIHRMFPIYWFEKNRTTT